jgi:hypothetical protein
MSFLAMVLRRVKAFLALARFLTGRKFEGFNLIFKMSVALHGKQAQESTVLIDTTVQEKNITYPTDAKLAIKIINRQAFLALARFLT